MEIPIIEINLDELRTNPGNAIAKLQEAGMPSDMIEAVLRDIRVYDDNRRSASDSELVGLELAYDCGHLIGFEEGYTKGLSDGLRAEPLDSHVHLDGMALGSTAQAAAGTLAPFDLNSALETTFNEAYDDRTLNIEEGQKRSECALSVLQAFERGKDCVLDKVLDAAATFLIEYLTPEFV